MKKSILTTVFMLMACAIQAQNDSTISRNVVVEREFQPVIQSAGKVNTTPRQVETTIEQVEVNFSTYTNRLENSYNLTTLNSSSVKFNRPRPANGWLEVGGGWPRSSLDFGYKLTPGKNTFIDLYAKHNGQWGIKSYSHSDAGMKFLTKLSALDVYFDVAGQHTFYTRYGRYYDGDNKLRKTYGQLNKADKQNIFEAVANVGIRSNSAMENLFFMLQTGYEAYIMPSLATEHIISSYGKVSWNNDDHIAGINIFVQNALYNIDSGINLPTSSYNPRHAFRFEPHYQYSSLKWQIYAGVNMDVNIGKGQLLSGNGNISFAPSPKVKAEYRIIPSMLAVYANVVGEYGTGILKKYNELNLYFDPVKGITSHHVSSYTPIDASIGFKIRPVSTLLLEVFGGYAHLRNQATLCAPTLSMLQNSDITYIDFLYSNYNKWTVGAKIDYHYQDIVKVIASGNYYHHQQLLIEDAPTNYDNTIVYDRPNWDVRLRVEANIDSKWAVYSDNYAHGSTYALHTDGSNTKLKPYIDLRLGAKYNVNRWLYVYVQLNNYLHRHNDIHYGYQSQGINGEAGLHWDF